MASWQSAEITIAWKDIHQESLGTQPERFADSSSERKTMSIRFSSEFGTSQDMSANSFSRCHFWPFVCIVEFPRYKNMFIVLTELRLGIQEIALIRQSVYVGQHVTTQLHLWWRSCDILFHVEWIWTNDLGAFQLYLTFLCQGSYTVSIVGRTSWSKLNRMYKGHFDETMMRH